tara:strand:- start:10 stop:699 length:690 start_codon:yes stop_codon:yes gene_type:complete
MEINPIIIPIWYDNKISLFLYQDNILSKSNYQKLLDFLELQQYKSGTCISGKPIPRLQIWYHMQNSFFCNTWKYRYDRWKSETYQPILLEVQDIIQQITNSLLLEFQKNVDSTVKEIPEYEIQTPIFNSCLINKYRNGQDSIKPHQDSSISFGEYPTISNLSIKSPRTMYVRALSKFKNISQKEISLELKPNSLFIMAGASQKYFTHSIPKSDSVDSRYSLTFRQHISV